MGCVSLCNGDLDDVFWTMKGLSTMEATKREGLTGFGGFELGFGVERLHRVISYL